MGKTIATNKKAYHNYQLTNPVECGIELTGGEVKSIRAGEVSFKDTFARIEDGEVFLHNLHINPYPQASYLNDDPDRVRKLLLNKREINKLIGRTREKGIALIPTKVYINNRGWVKIEVNAGRGKKQYDKREEIKKRAIEKGLKRAVKNYIR